MRFKTPLSVYVLWHPEFLEGIQVANEIFTILCRDVENPLSKSLGIPVYFRCVPALKKSTPLPIEFNESENTAILALIDDNLLIDEDYKGYTVDIHKLCSKSGNAARFYPVSFSENAYKIDKEIGSKNFIRCHLIKSDTAKSTLVAQIAHLKTNLLHELCRFLLNLKPSTEEPSTFLPIAPPPIKLFISHSKHDDSLLEATKFRDYINANTQLKTFFDTNDIGYGYNFENEIKNAIGESALIVFQSDSYSSREWCRIEVITAKTYSCPVVVVNAIQKGEKRAFPYMGNSPSIRWENNYQDVIDLTLEQVLFNVFSGKMLHNQAKLYGLDVDFTLSNHPELFSMINLKKKLKDKGQNFSVVLYPDPPIGNEENKLLNEMDSSLFFITPVLLPSLEI